MAGKDYSKDSLAAGTTGHIPARHARSATLIQTGGPGAPREFMLGEADAIIGRHDRATIPVLTHRAEMQSAVIKYHQEEFFIHDTDNAEDLFLNGIRIQSALLRDGDEIRFADLCFLFRES